MLLTPEDGVVAESPEQAELLNNAGHQQCYGKHPVTGAKCNFFISPEAKQNVLDQNQGYYTCPKCKSSRDLMEDMPWHGNPELEEHGDFHAGGGTRIGINMAEQAQIGEDLIHGLGSLPGYGKILWWHEGDATEPSPLDGATRDWGIEVKSIGYDAWNHRFIPGSPATKQTKNNQAQEMGLRGVLGVLVLLNYKTSMANVYVKEMPLEPWQNARGRMLSGVASFRTDSATHLLESVPFKNPFMSPSTNAPHVEDDLPF